MPDFAPFRAIRYTAAAGDPADLMAPPYDVIRAEQHVALCQRSPHNIVRLILGERASPHEPMPPEWYADAAASLAAWQEQNILETDPSPAFYLYTHHFEHEGQRRSRKLLLGALRLEPYDAARVLPHENTMPGPKADRLRLMQATNANLSPILGVFPDDDGRINGLLESLGAAPPVLDFTDDDGITHQLRVVAESGVQAALREALAPLPFYIGDGHHRYETALTYQEQQRAAMSGAAGELPCDRVLAACMSSADPGLVILPTHRMARWEGGPSAAEVMARAKRWFAVTPLDATTPQEALAALPPGGDRPTFAVYAGAQAGYSLLELRDEAALSAAPFAESSPARKLAATVFTHGFIQPLVGQPTTCDIAYTSDPQQAVGSVDAGGQRLAGLLPAVRVAELIAVVNAGERMPPKSTYFWPKAMTGLVLRSLAIR